MIQESMIKKIRNQLKYEKQGLYGNKDNIVHYDNIYGDCTCLIGDCTGLSGDCSGLRGDCTGLSGDCTGLRGDCSDLRGICTGLSGDCSGLIGDCSEIIKLVWGVNVNNMGKHKQEKEIGRAHV